MNRSARQPVRPFRAFVVAVAVATVLATGGCASSPAEPGIPPADVTAVELVETFPRDDVELAGGTVTWSTYEELGEDGDLYYAKQWFVDIAPASGTDVDVATDLLQNSGWDWDESASMLADGSDRWLFMADYSIQLTQQASTPFTLHYRVTQTLAP